MRLAYNIGKFTDIEKLCDRKLSHRNDQLRPQEPDFPLQPWTAGGDLLSRWHPVTSFRTLARKTTTDGGHVDTRPELLLVNSDGSKPFEEGFSGSPGEGFPGRTLAITGRLSDKQDL